MTEMIDIHRALRTITAKGINEVGKVILRYVISTMKADGGVIILFEDDGEKNEILSIEGGHKEIFEKLRPPEEIKGSIHRCLVEKGRTILADELFEDIDELKEKFPFVERLCFSPLEVEGKIIGLIGIVKEISDKDIEVFCTLGAISGIALDNVRIYRKMREKERMVENLSRYFSPSVVDSIMKSGTKELTGKTTATVLISDISGFTSMLETLPQDKFMQMINDFLSMSVEAVFSRGGTVDKFTGDGILAVFGAPIHCGNHAELAVLSAKDMLYNLQKLNQAWGKKGLPPIRIRIGIATGDVMYGNVGSDIRREFTVMGSTVNLASRLEQLNKKFKSRLLISQETYRRVKNMVLVTEHTTKIRGFSGVQKVYEVLTFLEKRK